MGRHEADHLPGAVNQRSPRKARIHGGIGPNERVEPATPERPRWPPDRADHSRCCSKRPRPRHHQDKVPHPGIRATRGDCATLGRQAQECQVGAGVAADDLGGNLTPVRQPDGDVLLPLEDVVSREHYPRCPGDPARGVAAPAGVHPHNASARPRNGIRQVIGKAAQELRRFGHPFLLSDPSGPVLEQRYRSAARLPSVVRVDRALIVWGGGVSPKR